MVSCYNPAVFKYDQTKSDQALEGDTGNFIEYESDSDGDFVKACTGDYDAAIEAEYAWLCAKYANSVCMFQKFGKMRLNGEVVDCGNL